MKERPIIFSAPMVRAILAGTKTQTRRLVKGSTEFKGPYNPAYLEAHRNAPGWGRICPYGQPGDRLWVRETWAWYGCERDPHEVVYRADQNGELAPATHGKWRSPIHMPRWASRITLELTSVRVERLQEITDYEACAEGVEPFRLPVHPAREGLRHVDGFAQLWDSINAKRAPWASNPWVWVLEFRR